MESDAKTEASNGEVKAEAVVAKEKKFERRSTSAVARLPRKIRKRVNEWLDTGVTYNEILRRLGKRAEGWSYQVILRWRRGGHQEWLEEQDRLEELERKREFALDLLERMPGQEVQEAGLRIAASQIYDMLNDLSPMTLKDKIKKNPEHYARIVNVLVRIGEGGLKFEKYRAEVAERKAKIEREIKAAKDEGVLTRETLEKIEEQIRLL